VRPPTRPQLQLQAQTQVERKSRSRGSEEGQTAGTPYPAPQPDHGSTGHPEPGRRGSELRQRLPLHLTLHQTVHSTLDRPSPTTCLRRSTQFRPHVNGETRCWEFGCIRTKASSAPAWLGRFIGGGPQSRSRSALEGDSGWVRPSQSLGSRRCCRLVIHRPRTTTAMKPPSLPGTRGRGLRTLIAVVAAIVMISACGGDSSQPDHTGSPTTSAP